MVLEVEIEHVVDERYISVAAMENSFEEHNTNQVRAESLKYAKYKQKQEIACVTEYLKLIKSSVADFQVEANAMSSEKNIAISKVHNLQGGLMQ